MNLRVTSFVHFVFVCLAVACSSSNGVSNASNGGGGAEVGGHSSTGGSASVGGHSATGGTSGTVVAGSNPGGKSATGGTNQTATVPPSCETSGPGISDCGADHESCCTSITVPGGTFFRTYTNDGSGAQGTADPATVSNFRLDKYLVTVGRFRQFVAAWNQGSGYTPPAGSGKHTHLNGGRGLADSGKPGSYEPGWNVDDDSNIQITSDSLLCDSAYATWSSTPGTQDALPINCVNWSEAYAFCIWDGGFLPSEAELMYAAAGGSEQRKYPWGSQDAGSNSQIAICNCNYPDASGTCTGVVNIAPVGTAKLGAGRWGHLDLAGDVTEWLLDWMSPSFVNPCTDCAYVADGSGRVIRDGFYSGTDATLLVSYRNSLYSSNRFASFGFRCARPA